MVPGDIFCGVKMKGDADDHSPGYSDEQYAYNLSVYCTMYTEASLPSTFVCVLRDF
jgi:hypothetical protein